MGTARQPLAFQTGSTQQAHRFASWPRVLLNRHERCCRGWVPDRRYPVSLPTALSHRRSVGAAAVASLSLPGSGHHRPVQGRGHAIGRRLCLCHAVARSGCGRRGRTAPALVPAGLRTSERKSLKERLDSLAVVGHERAGCGAPPTAAVMDVQTGRCWRRGAVHLATKPTAATELLRLPDCRRATTASRPAAGRLST